MLSNQGDTICAIATPQGEGAISIIRVSGPEALSCTKKIARFLPEQPDSHRVYYGHLRAQDTEEILDEVLVTYFAKGRSFTAEESLEISCHGSPAITQLILQELIRSGLRMAKRGEFTFRAFMSGRIDLVQAEGVLSLIQSQSAASARWALRQLKGGLSQEIQTIEESLSWALSRLEANIDFSSENIEFASQDQIEEQLFRALSSVRALISTYEAGRILRSSMRVALVGAPNVGKSSLLNLLAKQSRAIVSPIPGTTRDTIEVEVDLSGQTVTLVDTAGIRQASDEIESLGICRSYEEIETADVVLFLYDVSQMSSRLEVNELKKKNKPLIIVGNKVDVVPNSNSIGQAGDLLVSVTKNVGLENLKTKILSHLPRQFFESAAVLLSARHFELLQKIEQKIFAGLELQKKSLSPEFIISEVQEALVQSYELLGRKYDDEVLDRVFREFCLGK